MLTNSDFKELLSILDAHRVKYLIVGGYAVMKYAEPRYTKDLDIWIKADADNAVAVFASLREFGAPLANMTADDFTCEGYLYQMGVPPIRVDVLMSIPGLDFDKAWNNREIVVMDKVEVSFVSRNDLITSKLASVRPQDLIDADLLQKAAKNDTA